MVAIIADQGSKRKEERGEGRGEVATAEDRGDKQQGIEAGCLYERTSKVTPTRYYSREDGDWRM